MLTLSPISPEVFPWLCRVLRDETVKLTYMLPDLDETGARKLAERLAALSRDPRRFVRGIFVDGMPVGFLNDTEIQDTAIELGWVVDPRHQNHGYATEAVRLAAKELAEKGFTTLIAGAFSENKASLRVMEKAGMQKIPRQEMIFYRGTDRLCIFYQMALI